ncbi:Hypothetical_protein [Hexamita inflata]|uniref:Hypothetical_protein n=1 Tax=Hexamita inflata TaxID=28002 RepID=A0AA86TAP9_9EUKA|nr:Hypothetical protein HINF_LOCUS556 [Hexamita inflata]
MKTQGIMYLQQLHPPHPELHDSKRFSAKTAISVRLNLHSGFIGYCQSLVVIQFSSVVNSVIRSGNLFRRYNRICVFTISEFLIQRYKTALWATTPSPARSSGRYSGFFLGHIQRPSLNVTVSETCTLVVSQVMPNAIPSLLFLRVLFKIARSQLQARTQAYLGTFSSNYQGGTMKIVRVKHKQSQCDNSFQFRNDSELQVPCILRVHVHAVW